MEFVTFAYCIEQQEVLDYLKNDKLLKNLFLLSKNIVIKALLIWRLFIAALISKHLPLLLRT